MLLSHKSRYGTLLGKNGIFLKVVAAVVVVFLFQSRKNPTLYRDMYPDYNLHRGS